MRAFVGTSGWQYADWRGGFYPKELPHTAWLSFYAERFDTVEVNATFYRMPTTETVDRWRLAVPRDLTFAFKASRYLTHLRRLRDPEDPVATIVDRVNHLGDRAGPVLVQLPPRFPPEPERLAATLAAFPRDMRVAVEFRDRRWERDDVLDVLGAHGAAFVLADSPGARVPELVTATWSYVRFHRGSTDGWRYPAAKLRRWADRIAAMPIETCFVYCNNDPGGAAILDAVSMRELLAERGVEVGSRLPAAV